MGLRGNVLSRYRDLRKSVREPYSKEFASRLGAPLCEFSDFGSASIYKLILFWFHCDDSLKNWNNKIFLVNSKVNLDCLSLLVIEIHIE